MLPSNQVRRLREQRFALLAGLVLLGFGLCTLGLMRLQVVDHDKYLELSKENRVRLEVLRAPRGAIYDRHGELLADSAPSFLITFRPFPAESLRRIRMVESHDWIARVAALVREDTTEVRARVRAANRGGQTAVLRRDAPVDMLAAVEEMRSDLPGLDVQVEPLRHYPNGVLAAHLLGYAGEINASELEERADRGYRSGDLIGRTGVERSYEEILRGRDGAEFVVVNAMGRRVSTLSEGPPRLPVPGHDLTLTLDLRIQRSLEEAMANVDRGAAVAIDPRDGGILALVSRPTFDPNEFSHGLTLARWREMSEGGSNPLLDRAIQGAYPPGSTFKVVSMTAALKYGVARPETRLAACPGGMNYGGRWFACWNKRGHGSLDFIQALQNSCDVYFYQIGPMLGLPHLAETARAFGFGQRTGVDLPQERAGLVPDGAWYDRHWGVGKWRKGSLLNLAIGQGELLVTPIQLALMMAEASTGGRPLRPHVVREVRGVPEFHPDRPQQAGVSAGGEVWRAVQTGMELVVSAGTGTAARVPNVRVGGKTGTAQNPHGKDHALFACYAPAESPTIALAVVVENSGHGGSIAAPIAGIVLRRIFLADSIARLPAVVRRDSTARLEPDTTEATSAD